MRRYHDGLVAAGVSGYDWDRCWLDHRRGTWAGLIMAIAASMLVERTDRGDEMFLTMAAPARPPRPRPRRPRPPGGLTRTMGDVAEFAEAAEAWLDEHRGDAPRDYGAILPPDLRDEGTAWQRRLFDAGFAGIHWPEEHGGRGLTPEHTAAWIEACARVEVPPFINMVGVVLAGGSILRFGTPEQQAQHLRPILTGEQVWCQLFSEPGAGSDLASLTTSAERDGDEYVLTGQKVWCSNGRISDRGICLARTDPTAAPHKGLSFFLVDMGAPGRRGPPAAADDRRHRSSTRCSSTGCGCPSRDRLGPQNEGWNVAMATLTNERGHIGASAISLQRRLDAMADAAPVPTSAVARNELGGLLARGNALLALVGPAGPGRLGGGVADEARRHRAALRRRHDAGRRSPVPHGMLDGDAAAGVLGAPAGRIAGGTTAGAAQHHRRAHPRSAEGTSLLTRSRCWCWPVRCCATYCASRPTPSMKLELRKCWKRCPST